MPTSQIIVRQILFFGIKIKLVYKTVSHTKSYLIDNVTFGLVLINFWQLILFQSYFSEFIYSVFDMALTLGLADKSDIVMAAIIFFLIFKDYWACGHANYLHSRTKFGLLPSTSMLLFSISTYVLFYCTELAWQILLWILSSISKCIAESPH